MTHKLLHTEAWDALEKKKKALKEQYMLQGIYQGGVTVNIKGPSSVLLRSFCSCWLCQPFFLMRHEENSLFSCSGNLTFDFL